MVEQVVIISARIASLNRVFMADNIRCAANSVKQNSEQEVLTAPATPCFTPDMEATTDKSKQFRHYRLVRRRILRALHQKIFRRTHQPVKVWEVIGASETQFREHVKRHWRGQMSWGNYGQWIIVNKLSHRENKVIDEKSLRRYFHFRNFLPVWKNEVFKTTG
jgi:hypothetical protein